MTSTVISGAGAACAVGTGCDALWDALSRGADGLFPVTRFSVEEFDARIAGLWPQWKETPPLGRAALELALTACREALGHARVTAGPRTAVILGTCFAEDLTGFSELAQRTASELGARGPAFIVSTACSSSTSAIGLGRDLIERGDADLVLAGGVDVITRGVFAGFHSIGVVSRGKCAPFGEPAGLNLGEGAGIVVLESLERARARGVEPLGHVLGYGLSSDAHHETAPDPTGSGVARVIHSAFADAGVSAVDFISAHGTGTDSNDAAEWRGVRAALGDAADATPVSSTKSFLGHAQGAAGALELIAMLLCMKRGLVPQSLRSRPLRAAVPQSVVSDERPRALMVEHALKLSAAFGGANSAMVVGRSPRAPRPKRARRPVSVAGLAALGPHGFEVGGLEGAVLKGEVPAFELSKWVRSAPDRDIDPSGRYCTAATMLALRDAGITVKGAARDRSGLFTGSTRMPAQSVRDTLESIQRRGITGLAPVPFTHMVLNAPAGMCAKLLSLKGPLLAVSAGRASGLFAIVRAAEHLAARECADVIVAGGLDELPLEAIEWEKPPKGFSTNDDPALRYLSPRGERAGVRGQSVESSPTPETDGRSDPSPCPSPREGRGDAVSAEGAAFVALRAGNSDLELCGWSITGPHDVRGAVAQALEHCREVDGVYACLPSGGLDGTAAGRTPLGVFDAHAAFGAAEATASAFAFVLAASRVRAKKARRLLVVADSDSLCCAAVMGAPNGQ